MKPFWRWVAVVWRSCLSWCRRKLTDPARRFFKEKPDDVATAALDTSHPPTEEWKEKVLADFQAWLRDLPADPPPAAAASTDACDLYTVLSEVAALRQEIRLQNREQHKTLKTLNRYSESHHAVAESIRRLTENFRSFETNIRREAERRAMLPFLDLRDALLRGKEAVLRLSRRQGLLRRPPKGIESVAEGYQMAIRRCDRALAMVGVHPLHCEGRRFDPKTMRAIGSRVEPGAEKGIVLVEQLGGFTLGDEVVRTAEVIVSE
jgi:molecular chaperone GrpE